MGEEGGGDKHEGSETRGSCLCSLIFESNWKQTYVVTPDSCEP